MVETWRDYPTTEHRTTPHIQHIGQECTANGDQCLEENRGARGPSANSGPDDVNHEYGGRRGLPQRGHLDGQGEQPTRKRKRRRQTKAHLRIATLNMRGYRANGQVSPEGKWMQVNQLLREKRIAVLALQETHLSQERVLMLNRLFGEVMEVVYSPDPENETGARGVAFAINKRFVKKPEYETVEIVPGRALILDLKWSEDRRIRILNVYGPNDSHQNADFWSALKAHVQVENVELMAGDLNIVESPMDRVPERGDNGEAVDALNALTRAKNMVDGWRVTNADEKMYTYMQKSTGSQSRIDRIYIRKDILADADNWDVLDPGLVTDHRLAIVDMADRAAPYVGKGRWVMPKHLLTDEKMKKKMKEIGEELALKIEEMGERTEAQNPQVAYMAFKAKLIQAARSRAKEKVPIMQKRIENLREDLRRTLNPPPREPGEGEESESAREQRERHAAILQDRLGELERKRFETARKCVAARHRIQDEMMTKRWARS
ncbi:DNase I-like protein, partial [Cubamyces sp. BRFM 1775]